MALLDRGAVKTSRHALPLEFGRVQPAPHARLIIVCMGRNDGASGGERRSRRLSKSSGPAADAGLWYERSPEYATSSTRSGEAGPSQGRKSASTTSEREGGFSTRGGARSSRRPREADDEDEEDTRGWWERPEERTLQAYAAPKLEPWQEERLQLAYALGRRKAQVQELARELDVDRSVVIAWFKDFALRPQQERDAIMAARRSEEEVRRAEQKPRGAAEAATGQTGEDVRVVPAAKAGQEGPSGFVPFYLRKQLGPDKQKRLSGEVLRTLESVYDRTPFPSADVIRGLYELHRLSRDVALEWFAARRAADGITSSTQKRTGRESLRQKDRNMEGAFSGPEASQDARDRGTPESPGMLSLLGGAAGPAQRPSQPEKPQEPTVITLSPREMAVLRSSLPSPNKHKGRQMAEEMGIKTGPDSSVTQIGDVRYVAEAPDASARGEQVRASWRFRAAARPGAGEGQGGGRRLRLRGRPAGPGAGEAETGSDGDDL